MSRYTIELQPKQLEALDLLESPTGPRYLGYGGAMGGGKSHLAREWCLYRTLKYPGTEAYIVRKSFPELERNHINPFLKQHPEAREYYNASAHVVNLPNNSKLGFLYIDDLRDIDIHQGAEYPTLVVDEATQHTEDVFNGLRNRVRLPPQDKKRYPSMRARSLWTTNPGGVGHAWYQRVFIDRQFTAEEKPDRYGFVQALLDDNHKMMEADPEYADSLNSLPEDQRQAYRYGRWDVFSGQFFKGYKIIPTRPIREIGYVNLFAGCDWGRRDAASSHLVAVDQNGKHTVCGEVYSTGLTPESFGNAVMIKRSNLNVISTFADQSIWSKDQYGREIHAQGEVVDYQSGTVYSIADQIQSTGLILTRASRDRMARWTRILTLMERGQFEVMDCCTQLINELKYAVYNTKNNRRKEDIDEKCKDHALDDVGYCCLHTYAPVIGESKTESLDDALASMDQGYQTDDYGLGKVHGGV